MAKLRMSIYLIRDEYEDINAIVPKNSDMRDYPITDVLGQFGMLYIDADHRSVPKWTELFSSLFNPQDIGLESRSARAVLVANINGKILCITFGHAYFLIEPLAIVRNFGLKVALNTGGESSLRSIDKTSLDVVEIQTREQSSKEVDIYNFNYDFEVDILKSITARNEDGTETLSGRDAASVSSDVSLATLREYLTDLLEKYESDSYKQKFSWVDNISHVRDKHLISQLETCMVQKIQNNDISVWIAIPEIIHWEDISGFAYKKRKNPCTSPDIHLEQWKRQVVKTDRIDVDYLKRKMVHLYDTNHDLYKSWTIYSCLSAEIDLEGRKFILNDRCWYEVAPDFVTETEDYFNSVEESDVALPSHGMVIESEYNRAVIASNPSIFCLMDMKNITVAGGRNKIEFCDIFTKNKQLIHVKKYGASSVLSHLFQQGVVSGELFISADAGFRSKINEKLADGFKLDDVHQRPDPKEYEICFAIMSDQPGDLHIPFFSKVVMKNAVKRLQTYGYKVTKKKIES